ncbi:S8 family peptidase [Rhizobium leguminosarum]|uniref:S8 family peptidase n=1 Tax=Rhizobium leguminosarum TaxID=384 RepID=UPI001FE0CF9B|nr:S8 family peptidase [Rhizobium leguminosarum]
MEENAVQQNLLRSRISNDLAGKLTEGEEKSGAPNDSFKVIIECNQNFPGGLRSARDALVRAYLQTPNGKAVSYHPSGPDVVDAKAISQLASLFDERDIFSVEKSLWTDSYIFAVLTKSTVDALSTWSFAKTPIIYKIWLDHQLHRCVYESGRTIKCDAARASFAAAGKGIVWAVADTGVDRTHAHFDMYETLQLDGGLTHYDFTMDHPNLKESADAALIDSDGHGTHVAGIIAGRTVPSKKRGGVKIVVRTSERAEDNTSTLVDRPFPDEISGLAPYCKILSLKVLENAKEGDLSSLLAAIGFVQRMNDNGRAIKIHGLNLSLGYAFNPVWFAAGQSPLCLEVDRLVRSGVCVVTAAGNAGYGTVAQYGGSVERASHAGTIMDPGNAALAITVGSTHRDRPHSYGVSYFSSKGPTADGRMKPDLVAPGERIISCDARVKDEKEARFREDSGTSMAAPHVSGAIAAFLSVRSEFRGQPERVKEIFLTGATDLKRRPEYQGAGLIDLMRTLQVV